MADCNSQCRLADQNADMAPSVPTDTYSMGNARKKVLGGTLAS